MLEARQPSSPPTAGGSYPSRKGSGGSDRQRSEERGEGRDWSSDVCSSDLDGPTRSCSNGWLRLGGLFLFFGEAGGQHLLRQRRKTAGGDLADAGGAVAELLGDLGRLVAQPEAELEQRPA